MAKINSWLNKLGILEILLAVFPGSILAFIFKNDLWLLASFMAVCAIMPFARSYKYIAQSILHLIIIFLLSIGLSKLTNSVLIFVLVLVVISLVLGYIEANNAFLKPSISWLFIGIIYSSFKLSHYSLIYSQFLEIFAISLISVTLSLILSPQPIIKQHIQLHFKSSLIISYAKYVLPLIITIIFWQIFKIKEAEWLIWSSLSVINLELAKSKEKSILRFKGVLIGVILGVILISLLPENNWLNYLYFAGILFSLRSFNSYFVGVIVRSTFIILYANQNFIEIGKYRLMNILLGMLIGFLSSYVLSKLSNKRLNLYKI